MSTDCDNAVEVIGENRVRVKCRKCRTPITLDFGGLSREEALAMTAVIDRTPRECPGFHVELSGWRRLWRMDEAIEALYPCHCDLCRLEEAAVEAAKGGGM